MITNHDSKNGKAVINTALISKDPSAECEAFPMVEKINNDTASINDKTGQSNGEDGTPSSLVGDKKGVVVIVVVESSSSEDAIVVQITHF